MSGQRDERAPHHSKKRVGAEHAKLTNQRQAMPVEYAKLKDEVKGAEVIRRCVETVLQEEPQRQRDRVREMEL